MLSSPSHALFFKGLGYIVRLSGKIEVAPNRCLRRLCLAKCIIVEFIESIIELSSKAFVGIVKI
jgi:hypothetical protein